MLVMLTLKKKKKKSGLPQKLSGKGSAYQCRRHGFDPRSRKISHAAKQLTPCTTAIKPMLWSLEATTIEPKCCRY